MSKMSQLAMELDEQAVELGFRDREHAMQNGYEVISDGTFARLVETETEQEKAHKDYLERKEEILAELEGVQRTIEKVIQFINEGEI